MYSQPAIAIEDGRHLRLGLVIALLGFCIVLAVPFTFGNGFDTRTSLALSLLGAATAIFGVTVASVPVTAHPGTGSDR